MKRKIASVFVFLTLCLSSFGQKLFEYPVEGSKTAVVVCPGGSYYWLSKKWEGSEVAKKLNDAGISAYVLHYRHAGTRYFLFGPLVPSHHFPDALEDVLSAVDIVRSRGYEKVALVGFSAGGHLVLLAGETSPDKIDAIASVYPVVTFSEEQIVHKRSRNAFLGSHRNDASLRDSLSLEKHVPPTMPPVLLVNCVDDPIVNYHNSERMDEALSAAGVPHKYLQYPQGGHGFGASEEKNPYESVKWIDEFLVLLRSL